MANLILVLGDQLTHSLPMLQNAGADDTILMVEVNEEATYVKHHQKKIAFVFSAMRHFARELEHQGKQVRYIKLDDPANTHSFDTEVRRAVVAVTPNKLILTEAGEWRVQQKFANWQQQLEIPVEILPDSRFVCSHQTFNTWAKGRKQLRMEYFYRDMRRQTGLLMDGDTPLGGKWNYDHSNRSSYDGKVNIPTRQFPSPNSITQEVMALVGTTFGSHFGSLEPFIYAVTHAAAEEQLAHFISDYLPHFGRYQDAMVENAPFMFHSLISMYLNCGLLTPLAVCRQAEQAYHNGNAPLEAVEGFIRQIIGWREYVRGIYWLRMPEYAERDFFHTHGRPLPAFYWSGKTPMNCVRQTVLETRQHAYAHHIQRLMITGNFALLAGLDVRDVCDWYLSVYADAYEWVELPNTLGMALFGDGGDMASKPYAASGNYINKMSNYCQNCRYDPDAKTGDNACPFNYLYWDFLMRHEDKLAANMRLKYPYATLKKMNPQTKAQHRKNARVFIESL